MIRIVTHAQGIYYLITGIWPMLHMESFVAITGPKTDLWLVRMVALLSIGIGAHIIAQKKGPYVLHICAALAFIAIDCYYAFSDVIWDIYLADAVAQAILVGLIFVGIKKGPKPL